MKLISFILAACIMVLTIQPVFSFAGMNNAAHEKEMCMKMCCAKANNAASGKPIKSKGCCSGNACNPFMNCSCCPYFLNKAAIVLPLAISESASFYLVNDKVYSSYYTDCFHPPNAVSA